ncbi:MAG: DEAD/DEAH box helicase [Deltaproteobacteria bacterium]|nr:DEAD/DEAH box helicase [Deltaproteobacteria bacterium]
MITPYHAKYFAHELTKRCASDSAEKFAGVLADIQAQVDLNPHQIDAALFAFRSPLSKGAVLADEVGLGKTIEAGILLSQKWAERRRKLLIIVPANLRKQWHQELSDKFFLPGVILETKSFKEQIKAGNLNPFDQASIIICSYHFVRKQEAYLKHINWDLVVIDEAHRLRNVYKASNKIAHAIKSAVAHAPKVLLTATPLQNSLLELYGLVSVIDDYTFGDLKSFKSQYSKLTNEADFTELKNRLKPICQRTLRRQVLEYISYTDRFAIVEEFYPTPEEDKLYHQVSDYLQSPTLYALPASQRKLMTLILRRLLASSTYAISGTLDALVMRLEATEAKQIVVETQPEEIAPDFESATEIKEEWVDDDEGSEEPLAKQERLTPDQIKEMRAELTKLRDFSNLAHSIIKNSKGEKLLTALKKGLSAAREKGAKNKAVIFTESTRTQAYIRDILEKTEFAGKIVLFNGTNNDPKSKEIYKAWLKQHQGTDRITGSPTADLRASLVEYFEHEAVILVATEAAAEGINLQFCSLVVNYDLPWNPQRIEQRIGRCHRYGQKCDVVVVNFLNKSNAADQRVYEILAEKFKLFSGVFGASDEVLGAIESGVDFERRIVDIYQNCRTPQEIAEQFNQLQQELEMQIDEKMHQTRQKLLENFDQEVQEKLKLSHVKNAEYLNRFENWLWQITRYYLDGYARFEERPNTFYLEKNPFPKEHIHPGPYRAGKNIEEANLYRLGHPLAQRIIECCKTVATPNAQLKFNYSDSGIKVSILDGLIGKKGWVILKQLTVSAFETQDFLIFSGITDDSQQMDQGQCHRLFSLPAVIVSECDFASKDHADLMNLVILREQQLLLKKMGEKNAEYFEEEIEKLDYWAEDNRRSLKIALKDLDDNILELKRQARTAPNLPEKLKMQKEIKSLDQKRDEAWREYDFAAKEVEKQRDGLIDRVEARLKQNIKTQDLFTVRFEIV